MTVLKKKTPATTPTILTTNHLSTTASASNEVLKKAAPPKATPQIATKPALKVVESELPKGDVKREPTKETKEGAQPKPPEPPARAKRKEGTSHEAQKPAIPTEQPADSGELGRIDSEETEETEETGVAAYTGAPVTTRADFLEVAGQLTSLIDMKDMSITARYELWKQLNKNTPGNRFVTILAPWVLPMKVATTSKPKDAKPPTKEALYCPYCDDWSKFRVFPYTGYELCIGCSVSTNDYYTRTVNKLWK